MVVLERIDGKWLLSPDNLAEALAIVNPASELD
jgi:hypothetical protein